MEELFLVFIMDFSITIIQVREFFVPKDMCIVMSLWGLYDAKQLLVIQRGRKCAVDVDEVYLC